MAEGSLAFANLGRAVLEAVRAIPEGRVVEAALLGASLNVPARHVAYILAQLTPDEAAHLPWHRVVPRGGDFGRPEKRRARQQRQLDRLQAEGFVLADGRRLVLPMECLWQPDDRHSTTFWADVEDDRPAFGR